MFVFEDRSQKKKMLNMKAYRLTVLGSQHRSKNVNIRQFRFIQIRL